jgi:hypothetical protein
VIGNYSYYLVGHWGRVLVSTAVETVVAGSAYLVAEAVWWVARRTPAAEGTGFEPRRKS